MQQLKRDFIGFNRKIKVFQNILKKSNLEIVVIGGFEI